MFVRFIKFGIFGNGDNQILNFLGAPPQWAPPPAIDDQESRAG